ncbi:MAG: hypothetical protein ACR2OV_10990 [Hyphomicrobiaceae bacterium]
MLKEQSEHIEKREMVIAAAMREFAAELRMINVIDLVVFVETEQHGNIDNLVNSSAEMFFMPGSLAFANFAYVDLDWSRPPTVVLSLNLNHPDLTVFFDLRLTDNFAEIDLNHIEFRQPSEDQAENTYMLEQAIKSSLISPP